MARCSIIDSSLSFYDATEQISTLESQIEQRDSLIQRLSHSNNLIKEYFNVKYDSLNNEETYVLKDSKKTRVEVENCRQYMMLHILRIRIDFTKRKTNIF